MELSKIEVGTKVELVIYELNSVKVKVKYNSLILDHYKSDSIIVAAPISEGRIVPLSINSIIGVVVYGKGNLYNFKGRIIERGTVDNVAILAVEQTGDIKKIQRRNFFRFKWIKKIDFMIEEINGEKEKNTVYYEAVTKDISGGGIGFVTKKRLHIDDKIIIILVLKKTNVIKVKGRVVRCCKNNNYNNLYEAGIVFEEISPKTRRDIIKFIFYKQAELKQKGLL